MTDKKLPSPTSRINKITAGAKNPFILGIHYPTG
jgi:hypothetical protein